VEQAAFDLLATAGFQVTVLPLMGAGASLLSKGFVDAARQHAARLLDSILRLDPGEKAVIVGLEPPEIYTLKNDYPGLAPERTDQLGALVPRVWLLDEFLLRCDAFEHLRVVIKQKVEQSAEKPRLKFQPHCHQRAEPPAPDGLPTGVNATVHLLRSCGLDVELIDSGCCGMAGTFGYEAEHYELSMKVGELKLFPAIRESQDAHLIATGSACRLQIQQGTGEVAEHPLIYLARYL
jgi:Fe-S oxidoreductase